VRGLVFVDDRETTHVIPRAEVRHAEVVALSGDDWALKYQLAGTVLTPRSIVWRGECRPASLKALKTQASIGEYNQMAADFVRTVITRGHRDVHLERRSDNVFLVRSGLVENDARVVLCRQFIAEMALSARQTAIGPLDETRMHMLHEIHAAARDLLLPDWYPIQEEPS